MEQNDELIDICRICRTESTEERQLFYPCLCRGSIKFTHEDCLMQWLKQSDTKFCEICNHEYKFLKIYHPDTPKYLPARECFWSLLSVVKVLCHVLIRALTCFIIAPIIVWRIFYFLFFRESIPLSFSHSDLLPKNNDTIGLFMIIGTFCVYWMLGEINWQIHDNPPQYLNLFAEENEASDNNADEENIENNQPGVQAVDEPDNEEIENNADEEDDNWNPFYMDEIGNRLARLLFSLDVTTVGYLKDVFWMFIVFNLLFAIIFGLPYCTGSCAVHFLDLATRSLKPTTQPPEVHLILLPLALKIFLRFFIGCIIITAVLYISLSICRRMKFKSAYYTTSNYYLTLKVFTLCVVNFGLLPFYCGCFLAVCSVDLFSGTFPEDWIGIFEQNPHLSLFVLYVAGFLFIIILTCINSLVSEVLHPKILWFFPNVFVAYITWATQNSIDYNIGYFIQSIEVFSFQMLLLIYYPIRIALYTTTILPYRFENKLNITVYLNHLNNNNENYSEVTETTVDDTNLQFLFLFAASVFLVLPLFGIFYCDMVTRFVKSWCIIISRVLGLTDYLLAPRLVQQLIRDANVGPRIPPNHVPQEMGQFAIINQEHLGEPGGRHEFRIKQSLLFLLKVITFFFLFSVTIISITVFWLTVPVFLGRQTAYFLTGCFRVNDAITLSCGIIECSILLRIFYFLFIENLHWKWSMILASLKLWGIFILKCLLVGLALLIVLPMLCGTYLHFTSIGPACSSMHQSRLFIPTQVWSVGIYMVTFLLFTPYYSLALDVEPKPYFYRIFKQIYENGLNDLNVHYIYTKFVIPVFMALGFINAFLYVLVHSAIPILGLSIENEILFERYLYQSLVVIFYFVFLFTILSDVFSNTFEKIKNDKYLVAEKLLNYQSNA